MYKYSRLKLMFKLTADSNICFFLNNGTIEFVVYLSFCDV